MIRFRPVLGLKIEPFVMSLSISLHRDIKWVCAASCLDFDLQVLEPQIGVGGGKTFDNQDYFGVC